MEGSMYVFSLIISKVVVQLMSYCTIILYLKMVGSDLYVECDSYSQNTPIGQRAHISIGKPTMEMYRKDHNSGLLRKVGMLGNVYTYPLRRDGTSNIFP